MGAALHHPVALVAKAVKANGLDPFLIEKQVSVKPEIIFDDEIPDTRIAPIKELTGVYRQIFNRNGRWQMMGYRESSGDFDFKSAII